MTRRLDYRDSMLNAYPEVYSPAALDALEVLAPLNRDQHELMARRIARRLKRERGRQRMAFLDPQAVIPRTGIRVQDARDGNFDGSEIPADLMRQWIQGTGPATRPRASTESGLRNIAYALLSGADGWMFDGEDALGQVDTMSLDNQRNLQLAIAKDPHFLRVAEKVSAEMNHWAQGFFGRPIVADWRQQLDFTTKIFRVRGLHLDDRHVREKDGTGFSASIVDLVHYVVNNHQRLRDSGASIVLYLPKIQTAEEAALWNGRRALWQGGMEPNIPVGSAAGVAAGMRRAKGGGEREQLAGASGKWVAHWKMVHIVRPVWDEVGADNQLEREFPPLTYTQEDADGLVLLEPAPRTVRGARDLLSVALQYGNAFEQGFQAAALKPADFFGNDDVLYLMEDMATGEIRLSILWEWLHKQARFTEADAATGVAAGDPFTAALFARLLDEEYEKLLAARDRDVHDDSKTTTLPIAREIVATYVTNRAKLPWYIDLLNLNLNNHDLANARSRIRSYIEAFERDGTRITENLDFV